MSYEFSIKCKMRMQCDVLGCGRGHASVVNRGADRGADREPPKP